MSTSRPQICDHPLIQADELSIYISSRLRDGGVNLYSAFLLEHEAVRIHRNGYLQPAWNHRLSISGLFRIYMNCLTARAFHADKMEAITEDWFSEDISRLQERRPHFFTDRLSKGRSLTTDGAFLQLLSDMRDQYHSLSDDDGPFHVEVFPWDYAAPERELLKPGSQPQFRQTSPIDPEIEDLIVELCTEQWQ